MFGRMVKSAARMLILALAVGLCATGCGEKPRNDAEKKFLAAAKKGDAEAQYNLGACYEFGGGAPKDIDLAKQWYEKAAKQGNKKALARLRVLNPPKAPTKEAVEEIRKNALKYDADADALYKWAECCEFGFHTEQDRDRALRYYFLAAAKGHAEAGERARTLAEEMADKISEAEVNKFRADARNGNIEAQYQFARCLEFGIHVKQDVGAARSWYRKAADKGHEKAMKALGRKPKQPSRKPAKKRTGRK